MGLKTLAEFRGRLQFMLGNRGFEDSTLDNWINEGISDLTAQKDFDELTNVIEGEIPNGNSVVAWVGNPAIDGILELRTEDNLLTRIGFARFTQLDPTETSEHPLYWCRIDGLVTVWPKTKGVVKVAGIYLARHPTLSNPAEVTQIDARWDRVIELMAAHHALIDLEEADRAAYFLQMSQMMTARVEEKAGIEGRATAEPVRAIDSFEELRNAPW